MILNTFRSYEPSQISEGTWHRRHLSLAQGGTDKLLYRECVDKILRDIAYTDKQAARVKGRLLQGAGGAGKSSVLYQLVYHCRINGWIVLYIPSCHDVARDISSGLSQESAESILTSFLMSERVKLDQVSIRYENEMVSCSSYIEKQLEMGKAEEALSTVIFILSNECKIPFLLAVDEWNAIAVKRWSRITPEERQEFGFLTRFSPNSIRNGSWMYAISSTCDPIGKLDNNDSSELGVIIPTYNDEEFKAVYEFYCNNGYLSKEYKYNRVAEATGKVPRMLYELSLAYSRNPAENVLDEVFADFHNMTVGYYRGRIQNAIGKEGNDKKNMYKIVYEVYLNKDISILPLLWDISGIFILKGQYYVTACPSARSAFENYFITEFNGMFDALVTQKDFHGYIFEAQVLLCLKINFPGRTTVEVKDINLRGEHCPSREHKKISTTKYLELHDITDLPEKIEMGTLIKVPSGFPVVDAVAYSTDGSLYFIQFSLFSYSDHRTKVTSLLDECEGSTIIDYFKNRCFKANGSPAFPELSSKFDFKKKLPANIFYVYFTLSDHICKSKDMNSGNPVILVHRDEILSLFIYTDIFRKLLEAR